MGEKKQLPKRGEAASPRREHLIPSSPLMAALPGTREWSTLHAHPPSRLHAVHSVPLFTFRNALFHCGLPGD